MHRDDSVFDPDTPTAHLVRQTHICQQPVSDNGYLIGFQIVEAIEFAEVCHYLGAAAGLLCAVREDGDGGCSCEGLGAREERIRGRASGVRYDQDACGIVLAEVGEMGLDGLLADI